MIQSNNIRLGIVGSREFQDYELMKSKILQYFTKQDGLLRISEIISGGCVGADKLSERFAKEFDISTKIFPAQWSLHGRAAGFIRNEDIVKNSQVLLAFWNGSKGTQNSISIAKRLKIETIIVYF